MRVKEEIAEAQRRFGLLSFYDKFEHIIILVLTALIAVIIVFAIWNLALKIFLSIASSTFDPTDYAVFQAVFGMIFTVIIALIGTGELRCFTPSPRRSYPAQSSRPLPKWLSAAPHSAQ